MKLANGPEFSRLAAIAVKLNCTQLLQKPKTTSREISIARSAVEDPTIFAGQRVVGRHELHSTMCSLKTRNVVVTSRHLSLSLAYYAPSGIHGDRDLRPLAVGLAHQRQRSAWAGRHAQPTTDAAVGVQSDAVTLGSEGLHLAPFQTDPAALAGFGLELGDE